MLNFKRVFICNNWCRYSRKGAKLCLQWRMRSSASGSARYLRWKLHRPRSFSAHFWFWTRRLFRVSSRSGLEEKSPPRMIVELQTKHWSLSEHLRLWMFDKLELDAKFTSTKQILSLSVVDNLPAHFREERVTFPWDFSEGFQGNYFTASCQVSSASRTACWLCAQLADQDDYERTIEKVEQLSGGQVSAAGRIAIWN